MKYSDQLKHPKWQKKRLEILNRDNFTCKACGNIEQTLHVHHFKYQSGHKAWEYPDSNFITLCADCHLEEEQFIKNEHVGFIKISRYTDFSIRRMWHISFVMSFFHKHDPDSFARIRSLMNNCLEDNIEEYAKFCENYK